MLRGEEKLEEVDKKLIKAVIEFEVMKILWSGPIHMEDIRKKVAETLEIGLDSETITRILNLMEKNGYINKPMGLSKSYALTLEGKSLFEHTWQSLNFIKHLDSHSEELAKWMSLQLALRKIWIDEQTIENVIRNYQAEKMLKEQL
jgi:DNA-binding PadR family transcriptional regulator